MNKLSYFSKPNQDNLEGSKEVNQIWQKITKLRHDVFAEELQQYPINSKKQLDEPGQHFVTLSNESDLIGYVVSIHPTIENFAWRNILGKKY